MFSNHWNAIFLALAALLGAAASAHAQARFDARELTCAQINSLINSRGSVVLATGQFTYDRFVTNRTQCNPSEDARSTTIPASDTRSCRVQRCRPFSTGAP